jgi:hypothetical protein
MLLCAGALIAGPTAVSAGEPAGSDDWRYAATIYPWGAAINGETARSADSAVDHISFSGPLLAARFQF